MAGQRFLRHQHVEALFENPPPTFVEVHGSLAIENEANGFWLLVRHGESATLSQRSLCASLAAFAAWRLGAHPLFGVADIMRQYDASYCAFERATRPFFHAVFAMGRRQNG